MSIKDKVKQTNIQEAVYREVHYDENGKEFYKDPVSQAILLTKGLPIVCTILFVLMLILAFTVSVIAAFVLLVIMVLSLKPIKEKVLIPYLLKTGKYYDDIQFSDKK